MTSKPLKFNFVYHYSGAFLGIVFDGISIRNKKISSVQDYNDLKEEIVEDLKDNGNTLEVKNLHISSISFISKNIEKE